MVPSIQKGNEGFVHHMRIFECDGNFTEEHFNQGVECSVGTNVHIPYLKCRSSTLFAAWAVGREVNRSSGFISLHQRPL